MESNHFCLYVRQERYRYINKACSRFLFKWNFRNKPFLQVAILPCAPTKNRTWIDCLKDSSSSRWAMRAVLSIQNRNRTLNIYCLYFLKSSKNDLASRLTAFPDGFLSSVYESNVSSYVQDTDATITTHTRISPTSIPKYYIIAVVSQWDL